MNKKAENLVEEGIEFLNSEDYEKAEMCFKRVIDMDNNYAEAYYFRGYCYMEIKEYQKALSDLDMALKLDPGNWKARSYRNRNMSLFKSNNCKSKLNEDFNIEKLNIKVEDFEINNNIGSAECGINAAIWDSYISISLDISLNDEDTFDNNKIENYIKEFKKHLLWIENNKKVICDALIEDDMIGLAEDWVESSEEKIIDGKKVYVDGDDIFKLPISEEDFCKSLYFNSIGVRIDEDMEIMDSRIMIEAFIDTNPDYFASHSMEVTVSDDYEISIDGLAG